MTRDAPTTAPTVAPAITAVEAVLLLSDFDAAATVACWEPVLDCVGVAERVRVSVAVGVGDWEGDAPIDSVCVGVPEGEAVELSVTASMSGQASEGTK